MPLAYDRAMARTQTMVQLSDELVTQLDREAEQAGLSRSALIRDVLERHLRERSHAEKVRRYVEGYRRHPPGDVDDEWGDLEAAADRDGHDLARRLDAEEDAEGLSW
jgi:metal-responsive CopG/Arc/MetJ family transcriptional regulator